MGRREASAEGSEVAEVEASAGRKGVATKVASADRCTQTRCLVLPGRL